MPRHHEPSSSVGEARQSTSSDSTVSFQSSHDVERGYRPSQQPSPPGSQKRNGPLEPSRKFTRYQLFYIFILDGFGSLAISGGINFGIAYGKSSRTSAGIADEIPRKKTQANDLAAMYAHANTSKVQIRLFMMPSTLAGDAAVTIFVQVIVTWFVELLLVWLDLRQHSIQPIGFFGEPVRPWKRWLLLLPREPSQPLTPPMRLLRSVFGVLGQALRAFFLAIPAFLLLWPISVGALCGVGRKSGSDYVFNQTWAPQIFKLILGAVLGLLTTPWMAMFWLVRAGWEAKHNTAR